ncbi:MAG: class I SAM-dependent methyltransferase [Deltaproteobacteria bacterium]|nr:class I SAM-dependent methyltransferase [Deltaproteobacteria bacterium]
MEAYECAVCGSRDLEPLYPSGYQGMGVCSDFRLINGVRVENRICRQCGLIFNAEGIRGNTKRFYNATYSLMRFKDDAAIRHFSETRQISQAEQTRDVFFRLLFPKKKGRLLEVGAGKGDFLRCCREAISGWRITVLEPGESFSYLVHKLRGVEAHRSDYKDYDIEKGTYDIIVALGVLEHVENPLDMLQWVHRGLNDGGAVFLRVPNFEKNPNDLFCVDHLSKLTVATLHGLAEKAGFAVMDVESAGVPVFAVLKKEKRVMPNDDEHTYNTNMKIAGANAVFAERAIKAILKARETAARKREPFGIFGLAMSGIFAPIFSGFSPSDIAAYIDENKSFWGLRIHGRPVEGLGAIEEKKIRHIALTISPVYVKQVKEKLSRFRGLTVYVP